MYRKKRRVKKVRKARLLNCHPSSMRNRASSINCFSKAGTSLCLAIVPLFCCTARKPTNELETCCQFARKLFPAGVWEYILKTLPARRLRIRKWRNSATVQSVGGKTGQVCHYALIPNRKLPHNLPKVIQIFKVQMAYSFRPSFTCLKLHHFTHKYV